jgi:hypothetical protein
VRRSIVMLLAVSQIGSALHAQGTPRLDIATLERIRILPAADAFLREAPITVTASRSPRSAGGIHDFFSEGDYWWPDPQNPDGPYIQRDGMTNPANFVDHRRAMVRFSIQVGTLTSAYVLTGDERFAAHALAHLRAWFVDEATRMTPHLLYAQAIHGRMTGRGVGIIDTIHLVEVARATRILATSRSARAAEIATVTRWFTDYLAWMTTHRYGIDERDAKNNHATCWVMQVAAFAQLTGDATRLDDCRRRYKEILLPTQMALDGSFPLELRRTKPYGYSLFNLDAFATMCHILSTPADNLWSLVPFMRNKSAWPHAKDVMYFDQWPVRQPSLLFGGLALGERTYLDLWNTLAPPPAVEEVIRNLPIRHPLLWVDVVHARSAVVPTRGPGERGPAEPANVAAPSAPQSDLVRAEELRVPGKTGEASVIPFLEKSASVPSQWDMVGRAALEALKQVRRQH